MSQQAQTVTLVFQIEKETKNTIRYAEVAQNGMPPRIGTLYFQKWQFAGPPPQQITVTISY